MRRGRLRLPRPLGRLLQVLAFLFVVNTFVLPQLAGTREAIELIGSLDPRLLALGVAAEAASLAAVAHLIRTLVVEPHRPSAWVTNRIVLASRAASRVVPGGAAAGGVLSYRLLRRSGVPTSEAGFSIATQSLEQAAVLVAILFMATVVSIPLGGFDLGYVIAATVGAAVLLGLSVVVLAIARGEDGAVGGRDEGCGIGHASSWHAPGHEGRGCATAAIVWPARSRGARAQRQRGRGPV